MKLIDKNALVAGIERKRDDYINSLMTEQVHVLNDVLDFLDTLEVKEVDLLIHIIIAECCNWLAMNTNLSYDKIEGCRELMLIVKEEQFKAQKGE